MTNAFPQPLLQSSDLSGLILAEVKSEFRTNVMLNVET